MKLITKDSKSTNSNRFVIVEQPRYKAMHKKLPGKLLEVELTGEFNFVVYYLETPGVLDDKAVYQDFFMTEEEARDKYPDVELVRWVDVPKP